MTTAEEAEWFRKNIHEPMKREAAFYDSLDVTCPGCGLTWRHRLSQYNLFHGGHTGSEWDKDNDTGTHFKLVCPECRYILEEYEYE